MHPLKPLSLQFGDSGYLFQDFHACKLKLGVLPDLVKKKILVCGLLKFSPFTVGKPGARSHFKGPQAKAKALGVFLVASGAICDGIIVARSRHSIFFLEMR